MHSRQFALGARITTPRWASITPTCHALITVGWSQHVDIDIIEPHLSEALILPEVACPLLFLSYKAPYGERMNLELVTSFKNEPMGPVLSRLYGVGYWLHWTYRIPQTTKMKLMHYLYLSSLLSGVSLAIAIK